MLLSIVCDDFIEKFISWPPYDKICRKALAMSWRSSQNLVGEFSPKNCYNVYDETIEWMFVMKNISCQFICSRSLWWKYVSVLIKQPNYFVAKNLARIFPALLCDKNIYDASSVEIILLCDEIFCCNVVVGFGAIYSGKICVKEIFERNVKSNSS